MLLSLFLFKMLCGSCFLISAGPHWSGFPEENLATHLGVPARAALSILTLLQAWVHSDGYLVHLVGFSPLAQVSLKPSNTQH